MFSHHLFKIHSPTDMSTTYIFMTTDINIHHAYIIFINVNFGEHDDGELTTQLQTHVSVSTLVYLLTVRPLTVPNVRSEEVAAGV